MTDNFTCPVDGTRCESELCSFGCEQQRESAPTLRAALAPAADVAGEVDDISVAYYRAKHREWQQMGPGDRYEQHDAIGVLFRLLDAERARRVEVAFLLDRLASFERSGDNMTEDGIRDWGGHVAPSIARLRATNKDTQDE